MSDSALAIWGLVISIIGLACVLFFKTPKEQGKEMEERVDQLEDRHHVLNVGFVEFRATVISEMHNLTDAINRLSATLDRAGITTGEHRAARTRRGD